MANDPFDLNNLFGLSLNPQPLDDHTPGISPPVEQQYAQAAAGPVDPGMSMPGMQPGPPSAADSWQPHKRTTLGTIADVLLGFAGSPSAPFAHAARRKNVHEVMSQFSDNPMEAIKKMARIPGMEDEAWKMYHQYEQTHANDEVQRARVDYYRQNQQNKARETLASYMGGIAQAKDPNAVYQRMLPTLRAYAKQNGLPEESLSDAWDPDTATTVLFGGIKPQAQVQIQNTEEYRGKRLDQIDRGISNTENYRRERLGQIDRTIGNTEAYRRERLGQIDKAEGDRTQLQRERIQLQRDKMNAPPKPRAVKPGPKYVNTKYGPGEVSPDGNLMKISRGDGDVIYQKTGQNQWRMVKKVPKKEDN